MHSQAPKSLQRGLRVLELLSGHKHGMSFSELRDKLQLSDSACDRLLSGLQGLGYVEKNYQQGRYLPGPALHILCSEQGSDHLLRIVRPYLRQLRDETRNTSLLIAHQEVHMQVLERFLHEDSMALQAPGTTASNYRQPPWGWLFKDIETLKTSPVSSFSSVPSMAMIKQELKRLKTDGYVINRQRDRRRLAAPLYDHRGSVVAAIAVGGTPISLADEDIPQVAQSLISACRASQALLTQ